MNFTFLASFVAALALFSLIIRRSITRDTVPLDDYYEKEYKANFTRKKSLDNLNYITIPDEILSLRPANSTEEIDAYIKDLQDLSKEKIVNLTGISNTDLKLTYGTANITILSDYDSHYTNLVTILQKLAERLTAVGEKQDAIMLLEFAVSTGTDISKSYYLLASLYQEQNEGSKVNGLIQQAEALHTLMKDSIVRNLKASGQ